MAQKALFMSLIVVLISCTKNEDYQSTLVATDYQILAYPKLYTRSGEVTDRSIVDNYIKTARPGYFYMNGDTVITVPADTITFEKADTAYFKPHHSYGKRIVKRNGPYLYFYMVDTLVGYRTAENVLSNITNNIGIVKPYRRSICTFCSFDLVYDAYIAIGSQRQLQFPLLTYQITRQANGSYYGSARKNYNNVLDLSVLNLLKDGDTLAVQTARRVYN